MEIAKNNETIQKSEKIIALAQQRSDAKAKQAESVVRDALMKAQEAKRTNEETRRHWELQKIRADKSYATIQNMLSQKYDYKQQIKGFLTNYAGNVWIIKANGEKTSLNNGFLEPGDKVMTGDGTADIQMLDGRANAKLGPYSEFVIKKDTPEEQFLKLFKGKVYMAVDKIDDYVKKMKEKIDQYNENVQTIKQLNKEDINDLENYIKRKKFLLENHGCHSDSYGKIYCITAVCTVRGTKFISEIKENNIEVTVMEGIVDVSIPEKNETSSVKAGNKAIISANDVIKVEKIEQIEQW